MDRYGEAEIIYEDPLSIIIEDTATGQLYVSHDEVMQPDDIKALWARIETGYEITAQHFDSTEKRECFTLDRIKP